MKKKFLAVVAACAVLALSAAVLAGCSGGSSSKDSGEKKSESSFERTFVVGFDQGYPPYGYVGDDGEFTGFDIDLATEVCKRNNWELKLEPIDWDAKEALISSGAIDCIWNGFTYEGRENDYAWSDRYMLNEQVVVVKADSDVKTLEGLAGKTVMTQTESAAFDVLSDPEAQAALAATFKELQTIGDYNNAFMQLESGLVDAVACDLSIAEFQIAAKPNAYVKIGTLSSEHYAVGFKVGQDELAKQVSDTLKAMDKDGFVKELCEKYADQGMTYDNWVL